MATRAFAAAADGAHPSQRSEFHVPKVKHIATSVAGDLAERDVVYMIGNSLGLQPVRTKKLVNEELDVWATRGVNGHFDHPHDRPWVSTDDNVIEESAKIVGAKDKSEVVIMNTLTANLHFLLVSFYRPTPQRFKIIMEAKAFPSDYFAFSSQVQFHGFKASDAIVEVAPRDGESHLRLEDIVDVIRAEGDKVALVMFSGIQYYTGQLFDMKAITEVGHSVGAVVGFDLAHAVGNVPLQLHDWNVDFAAWCTYKYLNGGPGNIGGAFVHSRHNKSSLPRFSGWWGSDPATKFTMDNQFRPIEGAAGYRLSNPSVLAVTSLLASLQVFAQTDMASLRARSLLLTSYLEHLLLKLQALKPRFRIITPSDPHARGCQLSVLFEPGQMERVFEALIEKGVLTDERRPDVIRISPTPLYNTFEDCYAVYEALKEVL
ncbi:pyridoxal phosphate-dependent transferase [Chytriomyces sp. MP71]|nr:pyridoxal phosphate-dependent transferase [Chytriomyces sp. MP71]